MKKMYLKPSTEVVILSQKCYLMAGSPNVYEQIGSTEFSRGNDVSYYEDEEDY